ncbi:MAG: hypothetical protein ABJP45_14680 [Cyclobacteriaceae bacterium]
MKYLTLGLILFVSGCGSPSSEKSSEAKKPDAEEVAPDNSSADYLLSFTQIDNSVKVYMEDSLIFTSGTIHSSPEIDFEIDFTQFVEDGSETLRIELYNGVEPFDQQVDPLWGVRYDLIIKGNIVDFVHEFGDDNAIGLVYENSYVINEWIDVEE